MRVSPRASAALRAGHPALPGAQIYPYKPYMGEVMTMALRAPARLCGRDARAPKKAKPYPFF